MLNSSARIGWSVSGGNADPPLSARRMNFFTIAFKINGPRDQLHQRCIKPVAKRFRRRTAPADHNHGLTPPAGDPGFLPQQTDAGQDCVEVNSSIF